MIISRTPYRISFFGGGTDYPVWSLQNGGAVLASTFNKYCYITVRYLPPFFEHRTRIVYSKVEHCMKNEEIRHAAVREVLRFLGIHRGLEIHHDGDLPARAGTGSSSSFTVGLLHAVHALQGHMPSRLQLATESIHVEQEVLKETVGSQDQVMAAFGGLNRVVFHPHGDFTVTPLSLPRRRIEEFNSHLMLFFTGVQRTASAVAGNYVSDLGRKEGSLRRMLAMVDEGMAVLTQGDLSDFGHLLHEGWQLKRGLGPNISSPLIDDAYDEARAAGALGGKIMGAGAGGFLMLFAHPRDQECIRRRLDRLIHVPFRLERHGSQIIFLEPEEDYSVHDDWRSRQEIDPFREALLVEESGGVQAPPTMA